MKKINDDWTKTILIRDTVHGYIKIPKVIVEDIIDTCCFQRLKDIEQTGMRVLYPTASHDRFTHSLGVYHLGVLAFEKFRDNVYNFDNHSIYNKVSPEANPDLASIKWDKWGLLFSLACLLHDCGHSPFSHTLEFLYDMDFDTDPEEDYEWNKKVLESGKSTIDPLKARVNRKLCKILKSGDKRSFEDDLYSKAENKYKGIPHERMSAYYICALFYKEIYCLVNSFMVNKHKSRFENNYYDSSECPPEISSKEEFFDDMEFMCRMVTGCKYDLDFCNDYRNSEKHAMWEYELQLRNCVIKMLNSDLDVDNLDYTMRDAKVSGYESIQVDIERLLSAFTITRAYRMNEYELNSDDFNYTVSCEKFHGIIDAHIYGQFNMKTVEKAKNIEVNGNVSLVDEYKYDNVNPRKYFYTNADFAAQVKCGSIEITPGKINDIRQESCSLHIKGSLDGTFTGIIYGFDSSKVTANPDCCKELIYFAFNKSCISVLKSAVDARNYEYLWIYAHHIVTYQTRFLIIYLLDQYAKYIRKTEGLPLKDIIYHTINRASDISADTIKSGETVDHSTCHEGLRYLEKLERNYSSFNAEKDCDSEISQYIEKFKKYSLPNNERKELAEVYIISAAILLISELKPAFEANAESTFEYVKKLLGVVEKIIEDRYDTDSLDLLVKEAKRLINYIREYAWIDIGIMVKILFSKSPQNAIDGTNIDTNDMQKEKYLISDLDLLADLKKVFLKLDKDSKMQDKYNELYLALNEHFMRDYPSAAWKTYAEFRHHFRSWTYKEIEHLLEYMQDAECPPYDDRINYKIIFQKGLTPSESSTEGEYSDEVHVDTGDTGVIIDIRDALYEHGIKRFIWINQEIKIKELSQIDTYIIFGSNTLRLKDIDLMPQTQNKGKFGFMYYTLDKGKQFNLDSFLKRLHEIIRRDLSNKGKGGIKKGLGKGGEMVVYEKNCIIRDSVHLNIVIPEKFRRLIDTREYQKLRRIKQLATANMVFPGADHTRFAHSIGTFHIMKKIVEHFKAQLMEIDIKIEDEDWDALLAAALLHDLGHSLFSHALEDVEDIDFNHEEWTKSLIRADGTEIHQALVRFDCVNGQQNLDFPRRVIEYIEKRRESKEKSHLTEEPGITGGNTEIESLKDEPPEKIDNFQYIFSSLVSSQLDADRMDYLLRDAYHTGINFGNIDIEKLIEGMQVTIFEGKYRFCIAEEYISFIEDYILARFQMYRNVYMNSYKVFSERLLALILKRARELCVDLQDMKFRKILPPILKAIFDNEKIEIDMFHMLDDNVFIGAIMEWSDYEGDLILRELCLGFLNRSGFRKIDVLDNKKEDINDYINKVKQILTECKYEISPEGNEKILEYCLVTNFRKYSAYNIKEQIPILCRNGQIKNLSEVSVILSNNKLTEYEEHNVLYINYDILYSGRFQVETNIKEQMKMMKIHIENLENNVKNRSHIEIESKYILQLSESEKLKESIDRICDLLQQDGYVCEKPVDVYQSDTYHDKIVGKHFLLNDKHITLRIREKNEKRKLAMKFPAIGREEGHSQSNRFEAEYDMAEGSVLSDYEELIKKNFVRYGYPEVFNSVGELDEVIKVQNYRKSIIISKNKFKCEISFDNVKYVRIFSDQDRFPGQKNEYEEIQMEIELKSVYRHRVNLDALSSKIERMIHCGIEGMIRCEKVNDESKYSRGVKFLFGEL